MQLIKSGTAQYSVSYEYKTSPTSYCILYILTHSVGSIYSYIATIVWSIGCYSYDGYLHAHTGWEWAACSYMHACIYIPKVAIYSYAI